MPEWIWMFIIAVTVALFLLVVVVMTLYHRSTSAAAGGMKDLSEAMRRFTETNAELNSSVNSLMTKMHQDAMKTQQAERRPRAQDERG